MKPFLNDDFLLSTDTARTLFHEYAEGEPIADFHCHVNAKEIAADRRFSDITEAWLGGDHYKWRIMRACGTPERLVTGDAGPLEKFRAYARALERAVGNPLVHWSHLELRRYFGCDTVLNEDTAQEVYEYCSARLQDDLTVRRIIGISNVRVICTTDDPLDSLEWHEKIASDPAFPTKVLPGFRPDKALAVDKPGFPKYIGSLSELTGIPARSIDDVCAMLGARVAYFAAHGCRVSDHGLDEILFAEDSTLARSAFRSAMEGKLADRSQTAAYQTYILSFLARQYKKQGIAMQLHYGPLRNVNPGMYRMLGPDTGFDCIDTPPAGRSLTRLLGSLDATDSLPRTVLYAINPSDNAMLGTIAGCFSEEGVSGKVQHGPAWWFNDSLRGMREQIGTLASVGVLGNFIGMLTDSRSFLSYPRHEYFRRLLCEILGDWAENGEIPGDIEQLGGLVKDISFGNAMRWFGFEVD